MNQGSRRRQIVLSIAFPLAAAAAISAAGFAAHQTGVALTAAGVCLAVAVISAAVGVCVLVRHR